MANTNAEIDVVAMASGAAVRLALRSCVAHPARADIRSSVVKSPVAPRDWHPSVPFDGRSVWKIADGVRRSVLGFGGEIAAGELNPERSVRISAGQGVAFQGLNAPARYPRVRTDRGCGVSTESRALRQHVFTSKN